MMARQIARQFCRLREVHSLVYGHRASGENGRKLTAGTRVGSKSRLMDYLGLNFPPLIEVLQDRLELCLRKRFSKQVALERPATILTK